MAKTQRGFKKSKTSRRFNRAVTRVLQPRPQRSLYDADAWVKIQEVERIVVGVAAQPFSISALCFRNDTQQTGYNRTFYGQPEFTPYVNLYQNYELRGIKLEVALPVRASVVAAQMYAGPANQVDPQGLTIPTDEDLVGMPIVRTCAIDGSLTSMYYDTYRAIQGSSGNFGQVTTAVAGGTAAQCAFLKVKTIGDAVNTIVGECTVTYYIRFMNRKSG